MIFIDDRTGSINLPKLFPQDEVCVCRLDSADIMFIGSKNDTNVSVGIEHKTLDDVLKCICDGRFAGKQLPAMIAEYDEYWLLIEDDTRIGIDGQLQVRGYKQNWYDAKAGSRGFQWYEYETWISTMTNKTGLKVKQLKDRRETKHWIMLMYRWWLKGWENHHSDQVKDRSDQPRSLIHVAPSPVKSFASILPGVGWIKAANVEAKFDSIFDAVTADVNDWTEVSGIGPKMAYRIQEYIWSGGYRDGEDEDQKSR